MALVTLGDQQIQIDDSDLPWFKQFDWKISREGYVYRGSRETRDVVKLHRALAERHLGSAPSGIVDHINRDKRDNRWSSNLRVVDGSTSNKNKDSGRTKAEGNERPFGVTFRRS